MVERDDGFWKDFDDFLGSGLDARELVFELCFGFFVVDGEYTKVNNKI